MALTASEWHRTVWSTPGLGAPTDVARHGVFTGPTVEAGLRQAFVHVFLTRRAFRRDQAKAQHQGQNHSLDPEPTCFLGQGAQYPSTGPIPDSQRTSQGPRKSLEAGIQDAPSVPTLVSLQALWSPSPIGSQVPALLLPCLPGLTNSQGHSLVSSSSPGVRTPSII